MTGNTKQASPELAAVQSDGMLSEAASSNWRRHMPAGTAAKDAEATRADFEAEYAWLYPISTLLASGQKFKRDGRDGSGGYEDTAVQVGWTMWCAAIGASL